MSIRKLAFFCGRRTEGDRLTVEGKLEVRDSDFGIRPVTAAGGTVRVKDEVTILFAITADRE